jgi:hypothetical protein
MSYWGENPTLGEAASRVVLTGKPPLRGTVSARLSVRAAGLRGEIPDDQYRAVAFSKNKEYLHKPGSLTLLYEMYLRCIRELPEYTRKIAFDLLAFRYSMYAEVLKTGGY